MTYNELIEYRIKNIRDKKEEEFRVISLNSKLSIISDDLISKGTIDKAIVYPRKILEVALQNKAFGVILLHNHPNGDPSPSNNDITITKAIEIPAKVLGITIFDHLIVTTNGYFSFKKEKLL